MNLKGKIIAFVLLILILTIPFSGTAAKTTVAVTIMPQLEMVEAVAGARVEVVEMIPKGFSPSNYAPSPAEMRAFNEASIYFSIGVPADMQNILPRAEDQSDLEIVKLFERIESKYPHRYFGGGDAEAEEEHQEVEADEHGHGGRDPHIWLSPARVSYMVKIIRDELIEILPQYEAEFNKNAEVYLEKLAAVDQENKEILAPYEGEEILVYHPAFGYFIEHYGLEMIAIEAEGKEPGPRHLQEIIEFAKAEGINNVFYQAEIDSTKTRAVAEELGGKTIQLNPLAKNYLENLKIMAVKMEAELKKRDDN
ncbi:metal ABC transporter solute-binding protein, Zn/Mn family [Halanaerobium congolense]|jgi:zinc transport system substrate-binding protein|uniref:Zinc transport system substrate-binding protein n=1 Tax=Halanaerobium congolense TaxID=54121 RepID=A0A1G6JQ37_9FIRM|nr:zinc ABC transporter substrate-binding protein [Halanaerobium congolense]PXV65149.1 zinc transport system substrate-binding protein [Halanaerobium congolense]SDC20839.1 zinc transport system substrate-binding protein [Halanaerobium congolense]